MTDQIKAMIALLENVIINQELMKIRLQYQINDMGTDIDSIDLHFTLDLARKYVLSRKVYLNIHTGN